MGKHWKDKIYAAYEGDRNICDGTLREIAKKTGKSIEALRFFTRPCYRRLVEKRRAAGTGRDSFELVELEEGSNDEG